MCHYPKREVRLSMFGSHLSIAGSMLHALEEACTLGLDTVQVFTKNQQQWKVKPLEEELVKQWRAKLRELSWEDRTVSHASYLINLASNNDELWQKSVDLMTQEVERCEQLSIRYLVHHPGSHVGWSLEEGLARIAAAYKVIFERTKGYKTVSCLEGTTGSGSTIGGPLEHLQQLQEMILKASPQRERLGFCLDTCHLHAAGHDMSTYESAKEVFERFDALCGLEHVRVLHMNDSKGALGTKLDRHEHIGEGWVGGGAKKHTGAGTFSSAQLAKSGFAYVVRHPHFSQIPKIMETPKGNDPEGTSWDSINLSRLKALASPTTARKKG